ncbi:glycoside hydrolase family 61 protein [Phanerochaete carnosa HHB-10118-sp]|uniref:lytic cellulose monooxygenase (C4-dehydrogenating) n=1 Tax=Phanerochaete carnosa (strain HHB-10118-sp) TaxID=650164 RepID=K5WEP2_PHACS|nr:glycoside hydrolase family 61 protein [Phanerochaete carnosa HHB-10118-sp]EKM57539.1 glycoside hydrolase family 61 protein [Phanerochaete carnosa HHB-10118-sp]
MKAFFAVLAVVAAPFVAGHYTFPDFINDGETSADWVDIRETANHYSNAPVTDVTSTALRCYELDMQNTPGETQTATVQAGSTVGFYLDIMMSPASPAANSPDAGTGQTWFKIYEEVPQYTNGQLVFPATQQQVTFTIPSEVPSGQYLLRVEQIALHVAETYGGAQFYIGCAQINVENGGSGTPGPLVSIPGVYTGYEPGILINIYDLPSNFTGYQTPGPAVWQG